MWYAPLDLPGEERTVGTPEECRQRCVDIPECFYFNNFPNGGCHLAGKDATLQSMPGNPTVASGAVRCEGNLTENVEKQSNVKDLRRSLRIILRGTTLETLSFHDSRTSEISEGVLSTLNWSSRNMYVA